MEDVNRSQKEGSVGSIPGSTIGGEIKKWRTFIIFAILLFVIGIVAVIILC